MIVPFKESRPSLVTHFEIRVLITMCLGTNGDIVMHCFTCSDMTDSVDLMFPYVYWPQLLNYHNLLIFVRFLSNLNKSISIVVLLSVRVVFNFLIKIGFNFRPILATRQYLGLVLREKCARPYNWRQFDLVWFDLFISVWFSFSFAVLQICNKQNIAHFTHVKRIM